MNGERLARLSLRLDAIYCLAVGLLLVGASSWASSAVDIPRPLLVVAGVATAIWGAYVGWLALHRPTRLSTRWIMVANIGASVALALTGVVATGTALALAAAVLAVDVAAFAVSQGIALRRMSPPTHQGFVAT